MAEQTRHLARTVAAARPGPRGAGRRRRPGGHGLRPSRRRATNLRAIEAPRLALGGAVLADGGIVTRSPADQAEALAAILRAGRALADARRPMPPVLPDAAARMRGALAMLRHGDGRLGCFNGSAEGDAAWLADLLEGETPADGGFAPHWGYARLAAGSSCVLFDTGGPPPGPHAIAAHAAPLAFELSREAARIVVNGGAAARRRGPDWAGAARRTAAHTTLGIAGARCRRGPQRALCGPAGSAPLWREHGAQCQTAPGGQLAAATHSLYAPRFGAEHRRRLFLDAAGSDLRGEDVVVRQSGRGRLDVAIRFLLHPRRATLAQGGDSVLIAPHAGEAWRFRAGLADPAGLAHRAGRLHGRRKPCGGPRRSLSRAEAPAPEWTVRWASAIETPAARPRRRIVSRAPRRSMLPARRKSRPQSRGRHDRPNAPPDPPRAFYDRTRPCGAGPGAGGARGRAGLDRRIRPRRCARPALRYSMSRTSPASRR